MEGNTYEYKSSEPQKLSSWQEERCTISNHIKQKDLSNYTLNILEAGCGTNWGFDLRGVQHTLTGVDMDKNALDIRKNQTKDLDITILGDLRTLTLEESHYDVIYNSYLLEHIDGAEDLLKNFIYWLKPGGILILIIPNRDSAHGFLTRITPYWFHIFYRRHIRGFKNAGKPGYPPYPTFFDKVMSNSGIYEFCERHRLVIRAEYSAGHNRKIRLIFRILSLLLTWFVHIASFKRLFIKNANLIYVIEKP